MRLRLLGKPQALDSATGTWRDLPRKAAALLARLAVDTAVSREELASQLWPEAQGEKPRGSLRGLLRDLRQLTHSELVKGNDILELAIGVDHDLTGHAHPAGEPPGGLLLAAFEFGDLDDFSAWLGTARERLLTQRRRYLRDQVAAMEQVGHLNQAIAATERLLEAEPLDESTYRALMRLHCQRGDRAAALATYGRCKQLLETALQLEPSSPTRALATLIEAGEPLPTTPPPRTEPSSLQPRQLVARDLECQNVEEAWRSGLAVWLEGEAGIGKSQLMRHFASSATGTVMVSAIEGDSETPYGLLVRVLVALLAFARPKLDVDTRGELARLRPEFGAMAKRPASTQRLTQAVHQALDTWHGAGLAVLLLDDLHWSDRASAKLLFDAASASGSVNWMMGARPSWSGPEGLELDPGRWSRLTLQPFDVVAVEKWLHALPIPPTNASAWAMPLAEQSQGNALLLIEAMRAMRIDEAWRHGLEPEAVVWDANPTLETLLATRCERLSGRSLHLAQLVALSGAAFSHTMAAQVLGLNAFDLATLWAELEDLGVLQGDRLAHDTLRTPLTARIPPALMRALHALIAEAAAQAGAMPAEVAHHWWKAQNWTEAAVQFSAAARRVRALGARADERLLWEKAAECHERLGDAESAFAARNEAFDAMLAVAPIEQAEAAARALDSDAESDSQKLDASLALARSCATVYRHAEALDHARRAIETASRLPADARAPRARLLMCAALAATGQQDQALQALDAGREPILAGATPQLELEFHATYGYVSIWATRFDAAIASYSRALELAEWLDDCAEASVTASNLAVALTRHGDCAAALEAAKKGLAWRKRLGEADGAALGTAQQVLSMLLLRLSRFDEALEAAESALRTIGAASWRMLVSCECTLATAWLSLGDTDRARASFSPWPAGASSAGRLVRALAEAAIDAACGLPTLSALQAAREFTKGESETSRWALELRLAALSEPDAALASCREIAIGAAATGALSVEQAAWLREADALRRSGDTAAAVARWRQVLARLPHCMPIDIPMAGLWCTAAHILEDAGLEGERDDALRQGQAWLHQQALPHVPAPCRALFLANSPFVAELLSLTQNLARHH